MYQLLKSPAERHECRLYRKQTMISVSPTQLHSRDTYSQQTLPHCCLESSGFPTSRTDAFVKINHCGPEILNMPQCLCHLLQSSHVIRSGKHADKVMSFSDDIKAQAWAEEKLLEPSFALSCVGKAPKYPINRKPFFSRSRLVSWTLVEHVGM